MTTTKKSKACKLEELIQDYKSEKKTLEKFPTPPSKPKRKAVYSIFEYNKDEKEQREFHLKLTAYNEKKTVAVKREETAFKALLDYLPKSNTWFVTENKKQAVGIQRINWPGARPNILIRENPVIEELQPIETITP